jgi:hypothetical protein
VKNRIIGMVSGGRVVSGGRERRREIINLGVGFNVPKYLTYGGKRLWNRLPLNFRSTHLISLTGVIIHKYNSLSKILVREAWLVDGNDVIDGDHFHLFDCFQLIDYVEKDGGIIRNGDIISFETILSPYFHNNELKWQPDKNYIHRLTINGRSLESLKAERKLVKKLEQELVRELFKLESNEYSTRELFEKDLNKGSFNVMCARV